MRLPDSIEVKKIKLNNIPCLLIRPKSFNGKLPTLFHYHGWGSKKERQQFFGVTIATYGYQLILPDSDYHGDRNPLSEYSSKELLEYFPKIIIKSVEEFNEIKKEAVKFYNADENKIAVCGHSMGGFIASSIFGRDNGVKGLVCINGASSWKKAVDILKESVELKEEYNIYNNKLEEFDPITYKDKFYPRPILILHGDSDTSVPIQIQRHFYNEVAPLYKENPYKIRLDETINMNHHIGIRMVETAVMWLDSYLNN